MKAIHTFLLSIFELVFPQDVRIAIYDTLDCSYIETLATRTYIDTPYKCIAPFPYKKKLIRNAIFATKYHAHKRAASLLGISLAPYLAEELAERRMFGTYLQPLILPIPLHALRQQERGYNQAERIASALIEHLGDSAIHLCPKTLVRHKHTEAQAQRRSKTERLKNLQNAFSVPSPEVVFGKDIILLDDVVTTGATLASAKKTLQKAGARNVLCIAVAH